MILLIVEISSHSPTKSYYRQGCHEYDRDKVGYYHSLFCLGKVCRIVLVFNTCIKAYGTEDDDYAKCRCQDSVKSFIQGSINKKYNQKRDRMCLVVYGFMAIRIDQLVFIRASAALYIVQES